MFERPTENGSDRGSGLRSHRGLATRHAASVLRFRLGLLCFLLVVSLGALGYAATEGMPLDRAVYSAILSVGTVTEVPVQTAAGRAVNQFLVLGGIAFTALLAGSMAELIVGAQLRALLGTDRMERQISRLKNHFIVCGYGRMGQELVAQFQSRGSQVVVIDINEDRCRELSVAGVPAVHGDASDDQILAAAGVQRARGLITVAPRDADNIFITLSARALNRDLFIVARSVYDQDVKKLELAGANRVISPYVIGAQRIAAAMFVPQVVDFLDVQISRGDVAWELVDLHVSPGSSLDGCTLKSSDIRMTTGCTVLAIRRCNSEEFQSNPEPDTRLKAGDTLIVIGTHAQIEQLKVRVGVTG